MDNDKVLALVRELQARAARAQKEKDLPQWIQATTDAGKLLEWHKEGQAGPCPVDPESYRPGAAAGESGDDADAPQAAGNPSLDEGEPPEEEDERVRQLRRSLEQARIREDLDEEEKVLKALLALIPADAEALWEELAGLERKKQEKARRARLVKMKARLRDRNVLSDQTALREALEGAEILAADGEQDPDFLKAIEEGHRRYEDIAEKVYQSWAVAEDVEETVLAWRALVDGGAEWVELKGEGRVQPQVKYSNERQKYGAHLTERVSQRMEDASELQVHHPHRASDKLKDAQGLIQYAKENRLTDVESAFEDQVRDRLSEIEERAERWDSAHEAVEQATTATTPEDRLKWFLLARDLYPEYVDPDAVALEAKIADAVEPLATRACRQMQRHLDRAEGLRAAREFDEASHACDEGLAVADDLHPEAGTAPVRELETALNEELGHISDARVRLANLRQQVARIDGLLADDRFDEVEGSLERLEQEYSDEPEVKHLEIALALHRDRSQVLVTVRAALRSDPQHALDLLAALKARGIADEEVLFLEARALEQVPDLRPALEAYRVVQRAGGTLQQEAADREAKVEALLGDEEAVRGILDKVVALEKQRNHQEAFGLLQSVIDTPTSYRDEAGQRMEQLQAKWRKQLRQQMVKAQNSGDLDTAFLAAEELERHGLDGPLVSEIKAVKTAYFWAQAEEAKTPADEVQALTRLRGLRPRDPKITGRLLQAQKQASIQAASNKPAGEVVSSLEELYSRLEEEGHPGDRDVMHALADAWRRAMDYDTAAETVTRYRLYHPRGRVPRKWTTLEERISLEKGIVEDLAEVEKHSTNPGAETIDSLLDACKRFSGKPTGFLSDELEQTLNNRVDQTIEHLWASAGSHTGSSPSAQLGTMQGMVRILRLRSAENRARRRLRRQAMQIPGLAEWLLHRQSSVQKVSRASAASMLQETLECVNNTAVLLEAVRLTDVIQQRDVPGDLIRKLKQLEDGLEAVRQRRDRLRLMVDMLDAIQEDLGRCHSRSDFAHLRQDLNDLQKVAVPGTTDVGERGAEIQDQENKFNSVEEKIAQLQKAYQDYEDLQANDRLSLPDLIAQTQKNLKAIQGLCQEISRTDPDDVFNLQRQWLTAINASSRERVVVPDLATLQDMADRHLENLNLWIERHAMWTPLMQRFNTAQEQWSKVSDRRDELRKQLPGGLEKVRTFLKRHQDHTEYSLKDAQDCLSELRPGAVGVQDAYQDTPPHAYSPPAEGLKQMVDDNKRTIEEVLKDIPTSEDELNQAQARLEELIGQITQLEPGSTEWEVADEQLAEALTIDPTNPDMARCDRNWDTWKEEEDVSSAPSDRGWRLWPL